MNTAFAQQFAAEWIAAWNSHDLERILTHYADDFEMSSPWIVQYMNEPTGRLVGKDKVRAYWAAGFPHNPHLRFTLSTVFVGANSIAIHYRNEKGIGVSEVLFFDSAGRVIRAAAHYSTAKG